MPRDTPQSPLWKRLLVGTARKLFGKQIVERHYDLFAWHCERFFPFREHLTTEEWAYLETCFQSAVLYPEIPHDTGYDEYSYFTYSHRIQGAKVNSSRMAYGSLAFPTETLAQALPAMASRGIEVAPYFVESPESLFYGLGWDFVAAQYKVYFRILDLTTLPFSTLHDLIETTATTLSATTATRRRQEGLVSFTYNASGELHEEKVYIYPEPETGPHQELFAGTKGRVLMATSKRGTLTQYDVSSPEAWRARLSEAGHAIMDQYEALGYPLDTIAMRDSEEYTLYFPGEFMPFKRTSAAE